MSGDDAVGLSLGKVNFIVVVDIDDRVNHRGTRTSEYESGQIQASRNCLIRRGPCSGLSIIRRARSKVTSTESNVSFCFTANDIVTQALWLLLQTQELMRLSQIAATTQSELLTRLCGA